MSMTRDLRTLVLPRVRELFEVRLEVPREDSDTPRTASWVVRSEGTGQHLDSRSGIVVLRGQIMSARWGLLDDGRVERQRDSIDRLLVHLKQHCPELLGSGKCEHLDPETQQELQERGA